MHIHFIAIGGAAMHNLALALHQQGNHVTGSDDEINEPSKSRLEKAGLLPAEIGWFPEKLSTDMDAVIVGMHARSDNPELLKAKELNIKIYSYPEYLFEQTKDKKRLVVGGSHGKTSITAMVMHCLKYHNRTFDYMVGSQIQGFDTMVSLQQESKIAVLEGDEYLTSPIDLRPKFHLYKPHVAVLSGIAWDHINVFPTFEIYVDQFRIFIKTIEEGGKVFYNSDDEVLKKLCSEPFTSVQLIPYTMHEAAVNNGKTSLITSGGTIPLRIFGNHNLMNVQAAKYLCMEAGLTEIEFYQAIAEFSGAARRLEWIAGNEHTDIYLDFAHSPSKLKATTDAVKKQFPNRKLISVMELHTFSSLSKDFLKLYQGSMSGSDTAVVYFNPKTIEHKKLPAVTSYMILEAFHREDLLVFTDSIALEQYLRKQPYQNANLLLMSSGNFDGMNLRKLAKELTQ